MYTAVVKAYATPSVLWFPNYLNSVFLLCIVTRQLFSLFKPGFGKEYLMFSPIFRYPQGPSPISLTCFSLYIYFFPIKAHSAESVLFQLKDPLGCSHSHRSGYLWYCWYLPYTQVAEINLYHTVGNFITISARTWFMWEPESSIKH